MWQVLIMSNPITVAEGDNLNLGLVMSRSNENHRLMEVEIREGSGNPKESLFIYLFTKFWTKPIIFLGH